MSGRYVTIFLASGDLRAGCISPYETAPTMKNHPPLTRLTSLISLTLVFALAAGACAPAAPVPAASPTPIPSQTDLLKTISPTPTVQVTPPTPYHTATATPTRARPSPTPTITRTPWPADAPGLRELAEKRGFGIGAAVQSSLLAGEEAYRQVLAREFNVLTPEWEMKMCVIWPERDRWDFSGSDAIVAFAEEHQMRVRGHTLVWIDCLPEWIVQGGFSKEEATALLQEYIFTVVGRYRGKIAYWDVVNESLDRPPAWADLIGPEYVRLAFEWAHQADPQARLFYNDYDAEVMNSKADRVYNLVKGLLAEGVPIHGVGLQMHLKSRLARNSLAENIARLNALGLEVHITEFDFPLPAGVRDPYATQAEVYREAFQVCLEAQNCPVFVLWGFTDRYTWIESFLKTPDPRPLIFDRDYLPKPAYEALFQLLKEER